MNELWDIFWDYSDKEQYVKSLSWIRKLLAKEFNNVDLRYIHLNVLRCNNLDAEDDQEEPHVLSLCTEIIKNKELTPSITVAKAYSYRGEMRYYAIDRRKDFDKAKDIIKALNSEDSEAKFLKQFIELQYPLHVREYLFINTDYRNMFKF